MTSFLCGLASQMQKLFFIGSGSMVYNGDFSNDYPLAKKILCKNKARQRIFFFQWSTVEFEPSLFTTILNNQAFASRKFIFILSVCMHEGELSWLSETRFPIDTRGLQDKGLV